MTYTHTATGRRLELEPQTIWHRSGGPRFYRVVACPDVPDHPLVGTTIIRSDDEVHDDEVTT